MARTRKNVIEDILGTKLNQDEYHMVRHIYPVFHKAPGRIKTGPIEYRYNNTLYRYSLEDIRNFLEEFRQNPVGPQTKKEADELIERLTVVERLGK